MTSTRDRDPRGWIVSIAYQAVVDEELVRPVANSDALHAGWVSVDSLKKEELAFDHYEIIQYALNAH